MATKGGIEGLAETAFQLIFQADHLTADHMQDIANKIRRIATQITVETRRVKNFKFDIHWKSRVINVPIAIDKFRTLIDDLTHGLADKIRLIEAPFKDFASAVKLIGQTQDPLQGTQGVSKIAASFQAVEDFITQLDILVRDVETALDSLLQIGSLFDQVIQDIEHLEDLFLPQRSARTKQTVTYYKRN